MTKSLLVHQFAQSKGKEIEAGRLINTWTANTASSFPSEPFRKNVSICSCCVLWTKKCSEVTWVTNRCNKLTALSFHELSFVSNFLSILNFRRTWFWTQTNVTIRRAMFSIKQLKVETSYVKPPCFNWLLKYCLTYGQAAKYFTSSQLSLLLSLQSKAL